MNKKIIAGLLTAFLTGFFIYLCKCGLEDNA
ncbi:hypothetical protein IMSAGC012_00742 [Lachnospiraceae bacterium]|jgi:dolichol kinase|nr:hypothetical protein IMSAGC012_00742 [Lachnospiraceae bacterium]